MQAAAGTPIATVQKLLGHASVSTTMTHYIHAEDSAARESVNKLAVDKWL
jgi:integrase